MRTIAALIIALGLVGFGTPAQAATLATLQATKTGGLSPILSTKRAMEKGERVLVTGRLAGRSNVDKYPRMAIRADATMPGQAPVRGPVVSMNHYGRAYGTEYLTVRWLFVAPASGTWTITLRGEATTYYQTDIARIYAVDGTYLKLTKAHSKSSTWGPGSDACVGARAVPSPSDSSACRNPSKSVRVNRKTSATAGETFSVVSDLELSREYGSYPGGTSKVEITLYANQKTSSGNVCGTAVTKKYSQSITSRRHHVHKTMTLAGIKRCGSHVYTKTVVKHVSGNPVAIHDSKQSNAILLPA